MSNVLAPYVTTSMLNFKRIGVVVVEILEVGVIWRGLVCGVDATFAQSRLNWVLNHVMQRACSLSALALDLAWKIFIYVLVNDMITAGH